MSVRQSTSLIAALYAALPALMAGGVIHLYGDEQPASADAPALSPPLARITVDGGEWSADNTAAGLHLIADGRYVVKDPTEAWQLVGLASGTARWWRFTPGSSDTASCIDGSCAVEDEDAAEMYLPDLSISPETRLAVSNWVLAVPPLT